jgi:hypothetical protein
LKVKKQAILTVLLVALLTVSAEAAIIQGKFKATVTGIFASGPGVAPPVFHVGDTIAATYLYNTDAFPNLCPPGTPTYQGCYFRPTQPSSTDFSMTFQINDYTFGTSFTDPWAHVQIDVFNNAPEGDTIFDKFGLTAITSGPFPFTRSSSFFRLTRLLRSA